MRTLTLLSLIVLAVAASALLSPAPAAAQATGSDVSAGNSAIRARSDGSYSPPRVTAPAVAAVAPETHVFPSWRTNEEGVPPTPWARSACAGARSRR